MKQPKLYDNTRLSAHRNCNRMYYMRHILHLVPDHKAVALVFGGAWHDAMDVIWSKHKELTNDKLISAAFDAFMSHWKEAGLENFSTDSYDLKMRNPDTAVNMIINYISQRRTFLESIEVIAIEKPFAVPLDPTNPDILYVGRLDKVFKWQGRIWVGEHKTTTMGSGKSGFYSGFVESFSPNSQVDGYIHAAHMLYGDEVKGVLVDAALVNGACQDKFMFIPVERQTAMLNAWLFDTHEEMHKVQHNIDLLEQHDKDNLADFLPAFPKNTTACTMYGSCTYMDLCKTLKDPSKLPTTPMGFKVEKWEPFQELNLASIGVKPEEVV